MQAGRLCIPAALAPKQTLAVQAANVMKMSILQYTSGCVGTCSGDCSVEVSGQSSHDCLSS